jgi:microcystin-dependent protein
MSAVNPVCAQVFNGINYQAMALDANGDAIVNQAVRLRFGIVELSTSSPLIFQESHVTTTDAKGIFSLQIGSGVPELNTLDSVNWQNRPVYLKVEMDETGGTNYDFIGFVEFASVPFAFHAAYGEDADADPANEIQQLTLTGDSLSISEGNTVRLPAVSDNLGNHTAGQNLELGQFWISADGDNEGLRVLSDGTLRTDRIELEGRNTLFADQRQNIGLSLPLDLGTTASSNTLFGIQSGNRQMTGNSNVLIGRKSGQNLTTGNGNVFIGLQTGNMNTAGRNNVAIGLKAAKLNETGFENVMIGNLAGSQATGSFNTLVGASAGVSLQGGLGNVFLGGRAGLRNKSGSLNVFIGSRAGSDEMGSERLYIENTPSSSPLIYGEFDNDLVRINGDLDVTGGIAVNGTEVINNSGQWVGPVSISSGVPPGAIVMWSGSSSTIPAGWALCDGTGGTPDLRGRFVVGLDPGDPDYQNMGATGGQKEVTLTTDQMPSHSHGNRVNSGYGSSRSAANTYAAGMTYAASSYRSLRSSATNHTNTNEIVPEGGGQAHENRPPYFVLAFIIKL